MQISASRPNSLTWAPEKETLGEDGSDGGPIVTDGARNEKKSGSLGNAARAPERAAPLYSHIRELLPRTDVEGNSDAEGNAEAPNDNRSDPQRTGFFAQATKISMGNAFPALRTVARFLSLDSYRALPKHDKLPDLDDDIIEADLDDLLEPEDGPNAHPSDLLDWDEIEVDDLHPSPYQKYLFDLRIEAYLQQTRAELGACLIRG